MKNVFTILAFLTTSISTTQAQSDAERAAVKGMCGCFEVTFEYAETFPRDTSYKTLAKPYRATALELVVLEEERPEGLVLQHLLIVSDSTVIKHWRQDWEYQSDRLFSYAGANTWTVADKKPAEQRGRWVQKVFEVDDSPRYSGAATWFLNDGKQVWESTTDAPLPRREYTKRSDYQVMRRTNRHIITDWGWVHEQDNEKIVRGAQGAHVLVEEKGRNTYRKTDPARCAFAANWWKDKRAFWRHVRAEWDEVLDKNASLGITKQVEGRYMGQTFDDLAEKTYRNASETQEAIRTALEKHLIRNPLEPDKIKSDK